MAYTCPYCRLPSEADDPTCPHCGSPVDVRAAVSDSGWEELPPIRDMARLQVGQSICQVEGTYVPVADFTLAEGDLVYFSHHTLLWTTPETVLEPMPMSGGWNRTLAGMPLVMMQAHGPGRVALSHDHAGETVAVPLVPGQLVEVREHRFLAATRSVQYTWEQSNIWITTGTGNDRETHYPLGRWLDVFHAPQEPGLLLLHAPGNVFLRNLAAGEPILVQPSALLYKDPSVTMHLHLEYPAGAYSGFGMGSRYQARSVWLRLIGPGRVAVQSVFERPEGAAPIVRSSGATTFSW